MITVTVVYGEPGTGKSLIFRRLISRLQSREAGMERSWKKVRFTQWVGSQICVLGTRYLEDELFPGTDRLPMDVQADALEFFAKVSTLAGFAFTHFLLEGDRLANASFFDALLAMENVKLRLFCVKADPACHDRWLAQRGTAQNIKWLKGRKTKVANLNARFLHTTLTNDGVTPLHELADHLLARPTVGDSAPVDTPPQL